MNDERINELADAAAKEVVDRINKTMQGARPPEVQHPVWEPIATAIREALQEAGVRWIPVTERLPEPEREVELRNRPVNVILALDEGSPFWVTDDGDEIAVDDEAGQEWRYVSPPEPKEG